MIWLPSSIPSFSGVSRPDNVDLRRGHDLTRWTPHPTINLLRPKQLAKAKEVDMKEKRAKVYPRNVVRILQAERDGEMDDFMDVSGER